MMREREKKSREKLFELMREYPDLPVVPFVDSEIIADDGGYWLGSWGNVTVDEYLIAKRTERFMFKSNKDIFETLENYMSYAEYEALPETEEGCKPYYDALPWIKAIIVYIDLPE